MNTWFFQQLDKVRIDSRAYTLRVNGWTICSSPRQPPGAAVDQREERFSILPESWAVFSSFDLRT